MDSKDFKPDPFSFGCRGLGSTAEGSIPLRKPFMSGSSLLQNSGNNTMNLSPRKRKRKSAGSREYDKVKAEPGCSSYVPSFSSASDVHSDFKKLSFDSSSNVLTERLNSFPPSRKKAKLTSPQKNTLLNHFFTKTLEPKKEIPLHDDNDVQFICTVKKENPTTYSQKSNAAPSPEKKLVQMHDALGIGATSTDKSSQDLYGLLGIQDSDDWPSDSDLDDLGLSQAEPDIISNLPEHILEGIFAHLPFTHLLLDVALVCTRFRNIILNPKYLPWRKRYHGLKAEREDVVAHVNDIFTDLGLNDIRNALINIPRCLHKFRRRDRGRDEEMLKCLKNHYKYSWAVTFLNENVSDLSPATGKDLEPWLVVGALVALSDSVANISRILQLLSHSSCVLQDLIEALYCLATFLYAVTTHHKALYGPHYYVFYALYLFENEWQTKVSHINSAFYHKGQQSILKYSEGECNVRMTHEQMRIINHPLRDKQIVKVVAFAGTGKTSTLIQFAKLRQGMKFLLVVYNKSAQQHASRVFPGNVECRTMSSLAFQEGPGHLLKKKLTMKVRPLDIIPFLEQEVKIDRNTYARHVLSTIEKFMSSADPCLTLAHVLVTPRDPDDEPLDDKIALCVLRDAEVIWKKMSNPNDWEVRALHETYLKLYHLQSPVWDGYSCILIDEAQDCTPAMLDIVLSQKCPKILVGDPNQQIYSFRGAVNALDSVQSTHTYYLTQSFRFGPQIAYVAHCTLAMLKNVTHKTLVGGKQNSDVMGSHQGQLAIIARGNGTLFNEAVRLVCKGNRRTHEPKLHEIRAAFVGGLSNYGLDQLVDIFNLMKGSGTVKDRFISRFKTFQSLQMYAKKAKDQELFVKVKLVLGHGDNIPLYVQTINAKCRTSIKDANVVFTTAHKAKGLEFDTVCLTDDYSMGFGGMSTNCIIMKLLSQVQSSVSVEQAAEFNILYVAMTRAKKCLLLSESANIVIRACQESFEVPVLLESTAQETCLCCCNVVTKPPNKSFVLRKKPFRTMNRVTHVSGLYCKECAGPSDLEDLNSGFLLKDKSRHALVNVLESQIKERNVLPFDGINPFFNVELFPFHL